MHSSAGVPFLMSRRKLDSAAIKSTYLIAARCKDSLLNYVWKLNKRVGSVIIFSLRESKTKAKDEISGHGEISARNNIYDRMR